MDILKKLRNTVERTIPEQHKHLTALLFVHDKVTGITHISIGGQAPESAVLDIVKEIFEGFIKSETHISMAALEGIYNALHDETDPVFEINNN